MTLGLFVLVWVEKDYLVEQLEAASQSDHPFFKMYAALEKKQSDIFVTICVGQNKIQDCSDDDKKKIFEDVEVSDYWITFGVFLEKGAKCSGMGTDPLKKYFFIGDL